MEVLKITDSKLKIMLSVEDMKKYRLTKDSVDYNDAKTRKSFFDILNQVKLSHGFNVERDKVLIQFYPSKDGTSELFVTKLGILPPSSEKAISRSSRVTMLEARASLYFFEELDSLIRSARILRERNSSGASDIYLGEDGEYYLEIYERGMGEGGDSSLVSEYGKRLPPQYFHYISEHAKKLTHSNAIELFSKM